MYGGKSSFRKTDHGLLCTPDLVYCFFEFITYTFQIERVNYINSGRISWLSNPIQTFEFPAILPWLPMIHLRTWTAIQCDLLVAGWAFVGSSYVITCGVSGFFWHFGCLPFTTTFRKFRLESKWYTTFRVVPVENFREQRNVWKGSRGFSGRNVPNGTNLFFFWFERF